MPTTSITHDHRPADRRAAMTIIDARAAEESGASPERSRHCDLDRGSQERPHRPAAVTRDADRRDDRTSRHSGRGHPQEGWRERDRHGLGALSRSPRVVGSDDMALALVLTTVSPEVGGVLVRGEKGTAKSTMVRALAARAAADRRSSPGCRFSCDPADPDPAARTARTDSRADGQPGRPGWSSCRSAPPRTG